MLIYRYETFEINPDLDQTIEDVKGLLEKTQDLEIDNYEIVENSRAFSFVVKRRVELYPDTIK